MTDITGMKQNRMTDTKKKSHRIAVALVVSENSFCSLRFRNVCYSFRTTSVPSGSSARQVMPADLNMRLAAILDLVPSYLSQ